MTYPHSENSLDLNDADIQQFGELIPSGTVCPVVMTIRPGAAGPEGWLTASRTSDAQYLNCELTVTEGPYARRKLWVNLTWSGGKTNEKKQSMGGEITRSTLRAMLESARNINPTDMGEKAMAARRVNSFGEFDGLEFIIKVGIEKGQQGYPDKNKILMIITPDKKEYSNTQQGPLTTSPVQAPSWAQGSAPAPPAQNPKPTIPSWAQ
jgi:hypothetical protein